MELLKIEENRVTVVLDWPDLSMLAYLCRTVQASDGVPNAADWNLAHGWIGALAAFADAAGLASWAHTTSREDATLASWRTVAPLEADDRARKFARRAAFRAKHAAEAAAKEAPPAEGGEAA